MLSKEDYATKKRQQLTELKADMDILETKAKKTHDVYLEQIALLRSKHAEGVKQLEAIRTAADTNWEHLKSDTDKVWTALKDSMRVFKSHFKS